MDGSCDASGITTLDVQFRKADFSRLKSVFPPSCRKEGKETCGLG